MELTIAAELRVLQAAALSHPASKAN